MKIQELLDTLKTFDPEKDVLVALFKANNTGAVFEVEGVGENGGHAQLDIYEEGYAEEASDQ